MRMRTKDLFQFSSNKTNEADKYFLDWTSEISDNPRISY